MTKTQYGVVTTVAALCLFTMLANVFLGLANRSAQLDVASRQQYVQQSLQLEGPYREIIRALAELAARHNDADVREMLQRHGITYSVAAPPALVTPAAPSPARK
jgi:hypothetical protein